MKIFRSEQIKEIDGYTIKNEPIPSADLMERAASQLFRWYIRSFDRSRRVIVFTGPGNNGGDGLALARQLSMNRFNVEVFNIKFTDKVSDDWIVNRQRLQNETQSQFKDIENAGQMPFIGNEDVVIDALFGSGLTRPAEGLAADVIRHINQTDCIVISVDIPSGLFGEDNRANNPENIIRADFTLSFQFPKLAFMFSENAKYVGEWCALPIGLSNSAIRNTETPYLYLETGNILPLLRTRNKFDHKGNFGHGVLFAGSYGKMGAAVLGAKAALKTGIGLVTCHIPGCGNTIVQTAVPEAMVRIDGDEKLISDIQSVDQYEAAAIGPGIGTDPVTQKAFHKLLLLRDKPLVIDADGINILGQNKLWLSALPNNTILTPHVKEFERITDKANNSYIRLEKQIEFAVRYNSIVILKGACSSIATPGGKVYFNSTGNPGMATAGSGDVLTGVILSLLAQGYNPENAALTGVFLHGLAGDIAASKSGYESTNASDIINNIGNAFLKIRSNELHKSD
ncbi:MAG: NAD(P)H-hydrate dehydratase [Bacteroidales bacterium]